jgi:hypothetical protein
LNLVLKLIPLTVDGGEIIVGEIFPLLFDVPEDRVAQDSGGLLFVYPCHLCAAAYFIAVR